MRFRFRGALIVGVLGLAGLVAAQNVGGLRQANWDLPVTPADNTVVSEFFGALSAVQTVCPESLRASLAAERALAACAQLGKYFNAEVGRSMSELAFLTAPASWLSPWQADPGFGTVRRLELDGVEYFLAINEGTGLAYVVRFED